MSSTSKKHGNFVNEPIGHKSVQEVPGVGKAIGQQLSQSGTRTVSEQEWHESDQFSVTYSQFYLLQAENLMGRYLVSDRNPTEFKGWMQSNSNANSKQANDAFQALDTHRNRWS